MTTCSSHCKQTSVKLDKMLDKMNKLENLDKMLDKMNKLENLFKTTSDLTHTELVKLHVDMKNVKSKIKSTPEKRDEIEFDKSFLPFNDIEKLKDFNTLITDDNGEKEKFVKFLKHLGGVDYKNATHIIMKTILNPELGMQFSMKGRTESKKPFNQLEIFNCITG